MKTLGSLELLVLLSVRRLGANAYGAEVQRDVASVFRTKPAPETVYAALYAIEKKGLAVGVMVKPQERKAGSRSRRVYSLTARGREAAMIAAAAYRTAVETMYGELTMEDGHEREEEACTG